VKNGDFDLSETASYSETVIGVNMPHLQKPGSVPGTDSSRQFTNVVGLMHSAASEPAV